MTFYATPAVSSDRLVQSGDGFVVRYKAPISQEEGILSIQPDGSFGWRQAGTDGPWEHGKKEGNKLVFSDSAYPTGSYALLIVNG